MGIRKSEFGAKTQFLFNCVTQQSQISESVKQISKSVRQISESVRQISESVRQISDSVRQQTNWVIQEQGTNEMKTPNASTPTLY